MLIPAVLGVIALWLAFGAWRFLRMNDAAEHAAAAARQKRRVIFEGLLAPRIAREAVPEELLRSYANERVKITVERLAPEPGERPPDGA